MYIGREEKQLKVLTVRQFTSAQLKKRNIGFSEMKIDEGLKLKSRVSFLILFVDPALRISPLLFLKERKDP